MRGSLVLFAVMGLMLLGGCPDREVTPPDRGLDLLLRDFPHPGFDLRLDGGAPFKGDGVRTEGLKLRDGSTPALDWPPAVDWPVFPPPQPTMNVDLLFLVDNSNSMEEEQKNLIAQFPKLLQALRSPKLGQANPGGPPCTTVDTSNCKIPNVHVGVISSDLGAGNYSFSSCETPGGDGGKLKNSMTSPLGCPKPSDPWISYTNGVTNIVAGNADPILRVQESFACIAPLGVGGCGFENQLEAVRKALTPGVNPGFLRADSMLVVVMITDEDDCSAQKGALYDPTQQGLSDPLGPLTSFRCFEFGFVCDQASLRTPGVKTNCKPGQSYLFPTTGYVNFFKSLRPPQRLMVAAIAGPTQAVEVGLDGTNPTLKASCASINGQGVPGIRIKAVLDGLGQSGVYNLGMQGTSPVDVNICSTDFGPALQLIGQKIAAAL